MTIVRLRVRGRVRVRVRVRVVRIRDSVGLVEGALPPPPPSPYYDTDLPLPFHIPLTAACVRRTATMATFILTNPNLSLLFFSTNDCFSYIFYE